MQIVVFFIISMVLGSTGFCLTEVERLLKHTAAVNDVPRVRIAIGNGARMNQQYGKYGWTALHYAAANGSAAVAEYLVRKAGMKANITDRDQWTSLHVAAFYGKGGLAKLLIGMGANCALRNNKGELASLLAAREGHRELARAIRKNPDC